VTVQLGPGSLWTQGAPDGEWVSIGWTGAAQAVWVAGEDDRPLRVIGTSCSIEWTMTREQTRRLVDAAFPGLRWQLREGSRARRDYDRRRRARRRRNRR
jgi:hypothetical protein